MQSIPCVYRISVKAVIEDQDGKILLIRHADGGWELPGGGLEHGESPAKGLRRELKEELGASTDWVSDKPEAFWTIQGSVNVKWFAFVAYKAKVSGAKTGGEETDEFKYFSREAAAKLELHENTKAYFLD